MDRLSQWNWDTSAKETPLTPWQNQFEWIEEYQASPDGESVAAIVKVGEGEFNMCVNGETWPDSFDKLWYARFSPDGRLTAIVSKDGEWTIAVDGKVLQIHADQAAPNPTVERQIQQIVDSIQFE